MEFQVDNLRVHLIMIMIMIIIILCKVATGSLFLLNPVLAPQVILPPKSWEKWRVGHRLLRSKKAKDMFLQR